MPLEHSERPMREMTEEEVGSLRNTEIISQSWRKNHEDIIFTERDSVTTYYFADLGTEVRDFLRKLLEYNEVSKRLIRQTQGVVSELLLNAERHMGNPFYISFIISFRSDGSILVVLVNSCSKESFEKAESYVIQAVDAKAAGKEKLNELADKLLEQPGKGGMGLWNMVTQLNGDFWVSFHPEKKHMTSRCIIREK